MSLHKEGHNTGHKKKDKGVQIVIRRSGGMTIKNAIKESSFLKRFKFLTTKKK